MTNPFIQFHLCDFNMATDYCCAWDNYQAMEQFNNSLSLRAPMWYNVFETASDALMLVSADPEAESLS